MVADWVHELVAAVEMTVEKAAVNNLIELVGNWSAAIDSLIASQGMDAELLLPNLQARVAGMISAAVGFLG